MIQELNGKHFDNQYRDLEPGAGDKVISLKDGCIMLGGSREEIIFPDFGELPGECRSRKYRYLFSIGEDRYFLAHDLELKGYRYEKMQYLRKGSPKEALYAGLVALQIGRFYEALQFCGRCGHPMEHSDRERMMYCPSCGNREYPKICPCVIVGVIHDGKILVSHYKGGFTDHYALIAGFAEVGETIEECVAREVFEETHLRVKNLRFYKSQPWPFSDSLLFGFFCDLDGDDHIIIEEEELAMAKWISPEEVFEENNDYSLANEMLCKFKEDYGTK